MEQKLNQCYMFLKWWNSDQKAECGMERFTVTMQPSWLVKVEIKYPECRNCLTLEIVMQRFKKQ